MPRGSKPPEREAHFARRVVHILRPIPIPGEVFIGEIGNGPAARPEHLDDLFEELITRVQRLTFLVARVVALLADIDHAVDCQLARAPCQRVRNGRVNLHARMLLRPLHSQIALVPLFDKNRHDIHWRTVIDTAKTVSVEDTIHDMLRMQVRFISIGQDRDFGPLFGGCILSHGNDSLRN